MLYCRGTSPVAAAKSRLLAYCFPSPISVEIVLAVSVPTQGILSKRCPTSSSLYEPALDAEDFYNSKVIKDLDEFKKMSDVIVANRMDDEIMDVEDKVYTRDIYCRD